VWIVGVSSYDKVGWNGRETELWKEDQRDWWKTVCGAKGEVYAWWARDAHVSISLPPPPRLLRGFNYIYIYLCVYRERLPTRRRSRFAFDGGEKLNLLYSYIGIRYGKNNKTVVGFFRLEIRFVGCWFWSHRHFIAFIIFIYIYTTTSCKIMRPVCDDNPIIHVDVVGTLSRHRRRRLDSHRLIRTWSSRHRYPAPYTAHTCPHARLYPSSTIR